MGGDRKRRASFVSTSLPYDDDEEEKMEEFFALIRSIRATKEGMRKEANESKEKKREEDNRKAVWTPTFEWEDFMQEMEFKSPVIFSNFSNDEKGGEKTKGLESLDLNLSPSI